MSNTDFNTDFNSDLNRSPSALSEAQIDAEIKKLKLALSQRKADGRPLGHCVVTAYRQQIARFQSAKRATRNSSHKHS